VDDLLDGPLGSSLRRLGYSLQLFGVGPDMTETFTPPSGFVDTPHPPVAGPENLVSRTEEIDIDRPLDEVVTALDNIPLQDSISPEGGLPGVLGAHVLAGGKFDKPGSRHLIFLTDGSNAVEQVLEKTRTPTSYRFRYVVWNYTTAAARPLLYGLGEFHYTDAGNGRTHVRWTYSFELRKDRFPGFLGVALGGALLKAAFLNGPYAQWMKGTLALTKKNVEAWKG
jgi:hypothetical protein